MSTCLVLIVLAWTWIHIYSLTAALLMTVVAALIPPFAAIITNADSPILRGGIEGDGGGADGEDGDEADRGEGEAGRETMAQQQERDRD